MPIDFDMNKSIIAFCIGFPAIYTFFEFETSILLYITSALGLYLFMNDYMMIPQKPQQPQQQPVGPPPKKEHTPRLYAENERIRDLQKQDERLHPQQYDNRPPY